MKPILNQYELAVGEGRNVDELANAQGVNEAGVINRIYETDALPSLHVTATGGEVTVTIRYRNAANTFVPHGASQVVPVGDSAVINVDFGADAYSLRIEATGGADAQVTAGMTPWRRA